MSCCVAAKPKKLKAPFPYFGGKSRVADVVWRALGQPAHYLEPFFGSGAALLRRLDFDPTRHTETVCDADGHICNVWRAIKYHPQETAAICDWPVNHADLMARKKVLNAKTQLLNNLVNDDKWCDMELAGYWVWAASCWIGHGLIRPGQRPHHRGKRENYRIVLAGYYEEHRELLKHGWRVKRWKAGGGYGNQARNGESRGQRNRHREALFLSPNCLDI